MKIGFIPLRKGSKGIPGKNKKKLLGRPLFSWTLAEAVFSDLDKVVIYTDDEEIIEYINKEYVWTDKVVAEVRSAESATDTASTESAMLEYAEKSGFAFDVFCLIQATSPLTTRFDINACLSKVASADFDSALTVVRTHRFIWNEDGTPANYDFLKRPRRQDFDGLLIENGAVYAAKSDIMKQNSNRLGGKVGIVEMDEDTLIEIDSNSDWAIIEKLLENRLRSQKTSKRITHLFLDVDGVFTDGCVYFGSEGELMKKFDMRDGMGLEILRQHGVKVFVVTSENSKLVERRMEKLKITDAYFGVKDKFSLLNNIVTKNDLDFGNFAYIGDDVNDMASMLSVGWSLAPGNAMSAIKNIADFVLPADSANGAIRYACEFIMKYNQRYETN
ncbi:acylneuraminate cytidylyltransferase [Flavobacterium sp.]|uniref:acylneuraminate cytidylyltransferase n=1 Tax=Flavobacterium sp. TaxID=239 RepID=UPI0011FC5432|nr:acylneuraminate cytidylyltransferase [Flavobacterium sp.]RZJ71195.1 MAG: acylneuraminate cytidylyltransferase [Flavobacterium sp.]